MSIIGYARVSTEEQNLDLQLIALRNAGCTEIYSDQGYSGGRFDRPGLEQALLRLGKGDLIIVWRLDRLGRSIGGLIDLVSDLGERGVEFKSLAENIDTTSSTGKLLFHVVAALAEFERMLISERTRAGLDAAKERGAKLGRPRSLTDDVMQEALGFLEMGWTRKQVAEKLEVTPRTLRRYLNEAENENQSL